MMNTSKKADINIPTGTIIHGKWHRNSYTIIKPLGYGATGSVYLAQSKDGLVAIKISNDSIAITSEVNVLKHFAKVQGCLGPSLLDVDDWVRHGSTRKTTSFYVMEYLKGVDFLTFLRKNGKEWLSVLVLQLLSDLSRLHQEGWVFGDLKPENLLIVGPPPRVRWLDVGGTTIQGRAIKEFTEFYDRGYWGFGTRKAEPSYDLFAVAMIIINTAYPNRFSKKGVTGNYLPQLIQAIQSATTLQPYEKVIMKAIRGQYESALEMRQELIEMISLRRGERSATPPSNKNTTHVRPDLSQKKNVRMIKRKVELKKKCRGVFETILIAIFLIFAYFLYIAGHMM